MKAQNLALGVAAGAVFFFGLRKLGGVQGAASNLASAAVGVVGDAAAGTVLGIGDAIGLPRTSETECEKAKREGRTWDASFVCPAGDYFDYLLTPSPKAAQPAGRVSDGLSGEDSLPWSW